MPELTPTERRTLRARAHHLHPVVSVGQHGLTAAVLHEIDVNLLAHELIKVRVFSDDRGERETLLRSICAELDAAPVQHIGKLLVVWRPAPPKPPVRAAKRAPQVRRPRTPLPRAPARPPQGGARPKGGEANRGNARRRRRPG